jgi:hypothetical protein
MTKKEVKWAGKTPLETIEELDDACFTTKDGDIRIKFNMEVPLSVLIASTIEYLNIRADEAILGSNVFDTGLSDISYRPVSCKDDNAAGSCTGSVTLEVNASVRDIFTFDFPDHLARFHGA